MLRHVLKRPELLFLWIASGAGIVFCFVVPPMYVPDEPTHFYKAYDISTGHLAQRNIGQTSGDYTPSGIVEFATDAMDTRVRNPQNYHYVSDTKKLASIRLGDKKEAREYPNFASYPPVVYIPQAIGIMLGRIVSDKVIVFFYMARIVNLAVYIILGYLSIRAVVYGKWAFVAIGLLPMSIFVAASLSADALTIGLAMLFVALVVKGFYAAAPLTRRFWAELFIVSMGLVLAKQAYFMLLPIIGILLFAKDSSVPLRGLPDAKKRLVMVIAIGLVCVGALGLWAVATKNISKDVSVSQAAIGYYTDSKGQAKRLIKQPADFTKDLFNTTFSSPSNDIIRSGFGTFGWLDVFAPLWLDCLIAFILFASFGLDTKEKNELGTIPVLLILASIAMTYCAIMAALYIYWTLPNSTFISGFQGRYMIPMLVAAVPILGARYRHSISKLAISTAMVVTLASSAMIIFNHY